ncbi:MAG: thrombospondin type 3 repeat-containing protein [Myxococcota bacterium]
MTPPQTQALVFAVTLTLCAPAAAQSLDLNLAQPLTGRSNFIFTHGGDVNRHLELSLGAHAIYAEDLLSTADEPIIGRRTDLQLSGALGLFDFGELGIRVIGLSQNQPSSTAADFVGVDENDVPGTALGDIHVEPKFSLFNDGVSVALLSTVVIPTGEGSTFGGEDSLVISPAVAASIPAGPLRAGVNVGARFRDASTFGPLFQSDEIFFRGAVAYRLAEETELIGEAFGHLPLGDPDEIPEGLSTDDVNAVRQTFEATLAGQSRFGSVDVRAGLGAGLNDGYGSPAFRIFAGLVFRTGGEEEAPPPPPPAPPVEVDQDGDGVPVEVDQCPSEPEDKDGFDDEDGCPDPDNDGDGVLDGADRCPSQPEDMNGSKDDDGCPDNDEDLDGIIDVNDACIEDLEDVDGFEDEDGCPELDNDGDGIEDAYDACPNEPGEARRNGCPKRPRGKKRRRSR